MARPTQVPRYIGLNVQQTFLAYASIKLTQLVYELYYGKKGYYPKFSNKQDIFNFILTYSSLVDSVPMTSFLNKVYSRNTIVINYSHQIVAEHNVNLAAHEWLVILEDMPDKFTSSRHYGNVGIGQYALVLNVAAATIVTLGYNLNIVPNKHVYVDDGTSLLIQRTCVSLAIKAINDVEM